MKPSTAELYISEIHLEYPADSELILYNWLMNTVLQKSESAKSVDDYSFGYILKLNGIDQIEHILSVDNVESLRVVLAVANALGRNSWLLKEDTYKGLLILYAICADSQIGEISALGSKRISGFFTDYSYTASGCTSTIRFEEELEKKSNDKSHQLQLPDEFKWYIPERINPERTKKMLNSIVFETLANCDRLMTKICGTDKKLDFLLDLFVE